MRAKKAKGKDAWKKLKDFNDEKKDAMKRTKAVAGFIEGGTVEDQRSFFSSTYDKAYESWAAAVDLHLKKGKKDQKEINMLMGVLRGILTYCGDKIQSRAGHQAVVAEFLKKGLYKENRMALRETSFELLLLFINCFSAVEPQSPQDEFAALIPWAIDLNSFSESFRGRVNRGKWSTVLTAGADLTDVLLPATGSAATKRDAKAESLALLSTFLDFIGQHKFDLWFDVLKEYFIRVFYPELSLELGLSPPGTPLEGFLGYCPYEVQGALVERLVRWPAETSTSSVIWDSDFNTKLVMSLLTQGVSNNEEFDIVKKFVEGYHSMLWQPLAPPPSLTSKLLELRKEQVQNLQIPFTIVANGGHLEKQVEVCLSILGLFKLLIEKPGTVAPEEMKEFVQHKLLETVYALLQPETENPSLCAKLTGTSVATALAAWVRSNTVDPRLWEMLQGTVSGVFHLGEAIAQVDKMLTDLTHIRINAVYPPPPRKKPKPGRPADPGDAGPVVPDLKINGQEWTKETATFTWNNVYNILNGVNALEHHEMHEKAIKVITGAMDLMLMAEKLAPFAELTAPDREIPELLEVFGPLLFEACAVPSVQGSGKSHAFYALCRLVVRHHYQAYPLSFLVHFYRIIKDALVAAENPLPIFTIVRNSSDIFCLGLEGSSVLIPAYLIAIKLILSNDGRSPIAPPGYVKEAAIKVACSLVTFAGVHEPMEIPTTGLSNKDKAILGLEAGAPSMSAAHVKTVVDGILLDALPNASEAKHKTQCINGVALMIFDEVYRESPDVPSIEKWLQTLLEYTGSASPMPDVISVAFDAISSLLLEEPKLQALFPVVPTVINYICAFIQKQISHATMDSLLEKTISRHLSCLGQWIISSTPGIFNDESLCVAVFDTINLCMYGDTLKDVSGGQFWPTFQRLSSAPKHGSAAVQESAEALLFHLGAYHNNFPCKAGISVSSSSILETNDVEETDATKSLLFVMHDTFIVSLIEVPQAEGASIARIIVRDPIGKHVWDSRITWGSLFPPEGPSPTVSLVDAVRAVDGGAGGGPRLLDQAEGDGGDKVHHLLDSLRATHEDVDTDFTRPAAPHADLAGAFGQMEREFLAQVEDTRAHVADVRNEFVPAEPAAPTHSELPFHVCRTILNHLGFLDLADTGASAAFQRLENSDKSRRTIAQLDKSSGREALKIGVIYVKYGQDNQGIILHNDSSTREPVFSHFLRGLGWPVLVEHHPGYTGGLDKVNLSTGEESPYYANHLLEVVFHDITSMPTVDGDPQQIQKKRHVGNDIVHIVYSEHARDYSPKTITSQFNDAHIIIYPLHNGLFRISVARKDKVPLFGPLQDGMVVTKHLVSTLARATAINANRAVRYSTEGYKAPFPTRRGYITDLTEKYRVEKRMNGFLSTIVLGSV